MRLSDIKPQFCLVIGGAGSGKNHFIENHPTLSHYALIDVDAVKGEIGVALALKSIKPAMISAFSEQKDVAHPTTGSHLNGQKNKIALARQYGYTVTLILIDTPVEQAISQVRQRHRAGGHDVALEKIVESNKKARENFNLLKPFVDVAKIVQN